VGIEGVARVVKDQASDDIWHLSIEDLFAPSREPARAAGAGPFVLNLRTSSAAIGSPPKGLLPIDRLQVYQLERSHDGRPQFQLRLGIIESEVEADALLSMVREHYPAATKETARDDDKAAITCAARAAGPAKAARAGADEKAPVAQKRRKPSPPTARQPARPAARQAAPETAQQFRWDIDELLPGLAAAWPPTSAPEPTLPLFAAPKGERKPSKLSASHGSAKAQMPPPSPAAPSTKVSTGSGAKTAQLSVEVSHGVSHVDAVPKSAVVEQIESDPNAVTDQVEVLAPRSERHSLPQEPHAVIAAPAPAAETPEKLPVARIGALVESAETRQESANAPESDANASVVAAPPAGSPQLDACEPVGPSPPPGTPQSVGARAGAPLMDSTQTVRALTPLELADGEASCWFAIQLMLREEPIDAEQVPNLPIFAEYRLYSITGLEQDRVMHALRVGFFSSQLAAEAVSGYLGTYFDDPVIKRVSIAERERFADAVVAARKDVGTAALHAVIELASPAPPAERRLAAPSDRRAAGSDRRKSAANEATSLWSRLIAPRDR
jgi:hypothetical protein